MRSSTFSLSLVPFQEIDLRIRAFYKNSFRLPTFNDLYYPAVGTRDLQPEDAHQFNIGFTFITSDWKRRNNETFRDNENGGERKNNRNSISKQQEHDRLVLTLDLYRNRVRNKIVAYPTGNLHQWAMVNLGKAVITGMDLSAEGAVGVTETTALLVGINYTYQSALDKSDPSRSTYNHQIIYTPHHSGSGRAVLQLPWLDLAYTLLWSGERYFNGYNSKEYLMRGYADHGLSASRRFPSRFGSVHLKAEALNLLGKNYEIVRNYPMPGRSFRITASLHF